ncbi:hypothetical protein [Helicobacter sp. MIT 99-5507]|uniref:hypothetical protein n=1 Tax=Helicobacter sp. MIT 99-5507 TaxID=152489 RepID=UPI000E1F7E9D|nr:hypothetical protein [Helicobacter sp. MIT 99-5507]RDU58476.1 hypothetical protein CQA42_01415 [Helicobacter sp. MIT 99-5507]
MYKKILRIFYFILLSSLFLNANSVITQAPLIVEFPVFKEAEKICNGSDYTKIPCLVENLKNYSNKIYTKKSGQLGKISVILYAIDSNGRVTYPQEKLDNKYCEFIDTFGKKSNFVLSGNGFHYVLNYNFNYSSSQSKSYIVCHIVKNGNILSQISQPITIVPSRFDLDLSIQTIQDSIFSLNSNDRESQNANFDLILKTQNYPLIIKPNATARTINDEIDIGFSSLLLPLSMRFNRDNGKCDAIGENIQGVIKFTNGKYTNNNINLSFSDVASGELELIIGHNLSRDDMLQGKCLNSIPSNIDITNAGKILCQEPIVIRKRVDIIPYSFFVELENNGKQIYYNQHTFIPAIVHLPTTKLDIKAINDKNQLLKNFKNECFAKDLSIKLSDNKNNLLFINGNIPDSIIPQATFLDNSQSRVVRKLSSSGILDRDLTPLDAFSSNIINLNNTIMNIEFYNMGIKYPIYHIKPRIKNDWRVVLFRGRISLLSNTNQSDALIANPKINYEFYCKLPMCNILDLESVLSPRTRFPASNTQNWYINTAHPINFKVQDNNLILPDNLSIQSIGNILNGVQTIAIESNSKGIFDIKIRQGFGYDDFALFLYFSPSYINIREDLGVSTKINF